MSNLIQRLTQTNQFHENADVTTKEVVDALEALESANDMLEVASNTKSDIARKAISESDSAKAEIEELRAKILAMACVQVDREEALEAECAKWKAKAYENSGLVPTDNVAKENQVLRTEIERITPVCNMFKNTSEHLGNDNKNLREELTKLKAQAAKDAADAARYRWLASKDSTGVDIFFDTDYDPDEDEWTKETLDAAINAAMKESQ